MGTCLSNCCIDMMNIKNYFHTTYNIHKGATVQFTQLNNEESSRRLVSDKPTNVYENRLELFSIDADEAEELQPHIAASKSEPFTVASYMKWLQKQEVQVIEQTDGEESDPSARLGETDRELCVSSSSTANRSAPRPAAPSSSAAPNQNASLTGNSIVNPLANAPPSRRAAPNAMAINRSGKGGSSSQNRARSKSNDRVDPLDVELEWDDDEMEYGASRGRSGASAAGATGRSGGALLIGPSAKSGAQNSKRGKPNASANESLLRSGSKPDMEWDDDS